MKELDDWWGADINSGASLCTVDFLLHKCPLNTTDEV